MQENKQILQKTLANVIKKHRIARNKSINLIANEILMAKSLWSNVEKGEKDAQFSTLWRMAEGLEIPLSQLVKEIEDNIKDSVNFID